MHVYPIFLNDLHRRQCVVFGGGHEAERKVRDLVECGASVTVISPEITFDPTTYGARWIARDYEEGDLRDSFLAIVSETNPERTKPIWEEAQREKVLFNAMDDVPHCSFVAGSVVRRGKLTLSISTAGAAPALSVRMRQDFEQRVGPEYGEFLDWMAALRPPMAARYPDFDERRAIWYELVDSDILNLLAAGRREAARKRLQEIAGEEVAQAIDRQEPNGGAEQIHAPAARVYEAPPQD